jgi:7-cyano-7-deazaguanine synthase in queuosine biosynthesis
MKIVILYSGGLDSFLMYKWAKAYHPDATIKCLFYAHGQASEQAEIKSLPSFVEVRKIDWLNDKIKPVAKASDPFADAVYIPGRNLIFSALAASQELAEEIWMGTVWDEDNPEATDKNEPFRARTSSLLSYVLNPFIDSVTIRFPFVENEMTKETAVRWALSNGTPIDDIKATVSCWNQRYDKPCGKCKQCLKRLLVFGLNGFQEEYWECNPLESQKQQQLILDYIHAYNYNDDNDNDTKTNADEDNMVDMLARYLIPILANKSKLTPWEIEFMSKVYK